MYSILPSPTDFKAPLQLLSTYNETTGEWIQKLHLTYEHHNFLKVVGYVDKSNENLKMCLPGLVHVFQNISRARISREK
jgi:hypothetical protein